MDVKGGTCGFCSQETLVAEKASTSICAGCAALALDVLGEPPPAGLATHSPELEQAIRHLATARHELMALARQELTGESGEHDIPELDAESPEEPAADAAEPDWGARDDRPCSFCQRDSSGAGRLVAGPETRVCRDCAQAAFDVLGPETA